PPLAGGCSSTIIWFRDRPEVPKGTEPSIGVYSASPSYFRALGIPVLRGRGFGPQDRAGAPKVLIVNDAAARKFWPGEDPIGTQLAIGMNDFGDRAEVIGVVGDVRYGVAEEAAKPDVYICTLQSAPRSLVLYLRGRGDPAQLAAAVRGEIRSLSKELPVYD